MSLALAFAFSAIVFSTSMLSGVFGMAGGMILVGALLLILPVPAALMLQGVAQLTSNGWRAVIWRGYIGWRIAARYAVGLLLAALIFGLLRFVPDQGVVLITLGAAPLIALALPERYVTQVTHRGGAELCGLICTAFQLFSGVSGPVLDTFFVRTGMDRRQVIATKAACQMMTHLTKLAYFGILAGAVTDMIPPVFYGLAVALAIAGTTASRVLLQRLTDANFRLWTRRIVVAISLVYLVQGILYYL